MQPDEKHALELLQQGIQQQAIKEIAPFEHDAEVIKSINISMEAPLP